MDRYRPFPSDKLTLTFSLSNIFQLSLSFFFVFFFVFGVLCFCFFLFFFLLCVVLCLLILGVKNELFPTRFPVTWWRPDAELFLLIQMVVITVCLPMIRPSLRPLRFL